MMTNYGVTHVEYAIQSGDTVISGNSDAFRIASIMNLRDIMRTQLGGLSMAIGVIATLFVIIAAVVVMVILFILMESTVRCKRRELGIMKGLGYTSRELMVQPAAGHLSCRRHSGVLLPVCISWHTQDPEDFRL